MADQDPGGVPVTTRRVTLTARRRTIHARLRRLDRKMRQMIRHRPAQPSRAWINRRVAMLRRWAALWRVLTYRLCEPTPRPLWQQDILEEIAADCEWDADIHRDMGLSSCP